MSEDNKNTNKICGRLCVEIRGRLAAPLSVGSGEQVHSDADVVCDARDVPYLPGSSLAGSLRDYAGGMKEKELVNQLFGAPKNGVPGSEEDKQSRIFVYDAILEQAEMGIRDGVKLNENKAAIHEAKYDRQFVEQGAQFIIRLEILEREDCFGGSNNIRVMWEEDLEWIRLWLYGFTSGELRLGARSSRGFGKVEIQKARVRKFDMRDKDTYLKWLEWDWKKPDAFDGPDSEDIPASAMKQEHIAGLEHCLEVRLCVPATLLIRTYAASFAKPEEFPDYGQMTVGGKGKQALIPGSSWAGAFRSHIAKIITELRPAASWEAVQKELEPMFGTWSKTKERSGDLCASRVIFEETVIQGGHGLPIARIAVDRFTGGNVQGALYEELPWTGGNALLRIRWKKRKTFMTDASVCGLLLWAVKDLQSGILSVGGETSVGRGIFEPQKGCIEIQKDGRPLSNEEQKESMKAAADWVQSINIDWNER